MPLGSVPAGAAASCATTASVYCLVVERSGMNPSVSPTLTVNVYVPVAVGVPEMDVCPPGVPLGRPSTIVKPGGSEPETILQPMPRPPVPTTVSVAE